MGLPPQVAEAAKAHRADAVLDGEEALQKAEALARKREAHNANMRFHRSLQSTMSKILADQISMIGFRA